MGHLFKLLLKYQDNMKLLWILCALAVLLSMVAAVPKAEKGEVGSLLTEQVQDMDLAESKAKKLAKKAAKAHKKSFKGPDKSRENSPQGLRKRIQQCYDGRSFMTSAPIK